MPSTFFLFVIYISSVFSFVASEFDLNSIKSSLDDPNYSKFIHLFSTPSSTKNFIQNPRIIGGSLATPGQFPFSVFMLLKDSQNNTFGCGGSLIKRNWILTAAHCLHERKEGVIFAGVVDLVNGTGAWKAAINQSHMHIHPEYVMERYMDNDIALIKLPGVISCAKNVGIVDLPCECDAKADLDGMEVTTMGFGADKTASMDITHQMKFVEMEVISRCECKKHFPFPIFDSMICTSTSGGRSSW